MSRARPDRKKTLRFQAYFMIGLTLLSIATIYSLILFSFEKKRRQTVLKKIESSLHAIIEQRQPLIANELYLNHQEAVRLAIDGMLRIEGMLAIVVFREDGSIFAASGINPSNNLSETERRQLSGDYRFYVTRWEDQPAAIYSKPIFVIGETLGYVKVYYSLTDVVRESRRTILIFSALLLTILLAMAILLHTFLTRSVIRPVGLIIATMRRVQEGQLGQQVTLDVQNEIGEMARTFNHMSLDKARIYQDITSLNKHLEQKVAGSTKELERKRITLKATLARLRNTQEELLAQSDQLEIARREAEQAKQAAEAASQAKSEFISHMSHELRTPLNGIMGYAQILMRDKSFSGSQKDGIHVINQSSLHLLTLINDILDLSKIEARRMELSPTEFRFKVFLQEIADIIQMKADQKRIEFSFDINHSALPIGVCTDEKRLRQVLLNLLGNAVKFTETGQVVFRVYPLSPDDTGGKQDATARHIPPRPGEAENQTESDVGCVTLRFEIEDTGSGIAAAQLEKIFLPFEQAGRRISRATGTGLGLAISQRLVKLMQSKIHVKSAIGKGSRFWFDLDLPLIEMGDENRVVRTKSIIGYTGKKRTLLMVDDNTGARTMMSSLLEPIGFRCVQARDGAEAISILNDLNPDAILLDLVMPGMTGLETVKAIRKMHELEPVAIIAISADTFQRHQEASILAGCDAFLPKPVTAEMLFELLAIHLNIRWIYEAPEKTLAMDGQPGRIVHEDGELAPLPQAEMEILFEMAKMGDMRSIQERVRSMETLDHRHRPFARKLYALSKNYQDKQILTLFEQYMPQRRKSGRVSEPRRRG